MSGDAGTGVIPPPPRGAGPGPPLRRRLLALRRRWHAGRARRLPVPVISIGNLHLGGSGKTPLVAAIARHLRDADRRVAILSRGYGRHSRGIVVVSTGDGPRSTPRIAGDEPFMLSERLPGIAVVVGEDRYRAGAHALEALSPRPELFLLDDGFSHLGLERDLDLLVFPAHRPWGNGRLLPFGTLREPLGATALADAVVLTGVDGPGTGAGERLAERLRPFGFAGPGFAAALIPELAAPGAASPVLLVTGVAHPERVLATARAAGLEVAGHLAFADHHRFPPRSLRRIEAARARAGAASVVATSKDIAKLAGRLSSPLRELGVAAAPEPAFWAWLDDALARIAETPSGRPARARQPSPMTNRRSPPSTD